MVTLIIMDGLGTTNTMEGNAVAAAKTPNLDAYRAKYPHTTLGASGLAVGLPDDSVQGNSEVGHMNIGGGRVVYQEVTMINKAIEEGGFFENVEFLNAIENCKKNGSALHIYGLITDAAVHAHNAHMFALMELAKRHDLEKVFIHAILDGRDTPQKSAEKYLSLIDDKIVEIGVGKIATCIGRYWIMDRDMNNDRVEKGFRAMTQSEGAHYSSWRDGVAAAYAQEETDEFIKPFVITENGMHAGRIKNGDSVIFFNFRRDRAKQITRMFVENLDVHYVGMTQYDKTIPNVHTAFLPQDMTNHLGEYLSKMGKKNFRVAETEKFNHITFYFNALIDECYPGEERVLIPSEKVATFDLSPKMRAKDITDATVKLIESGAYDFGAVNLANPDLLGHTGVIDAAIVGVEAVDTGVGEIVRATLEAGGVAIVTADHGNAEQMIYPGTTTVCTSHTTNPVPFYIIGADHVHRLRADGVLGDIAPTVLDLMGIEKPAEMTGKTLIES